MQMAKLTLGSALALLGIMLGARALASQPEPAAAPPVAEDSAQPDVSGCQACHGREGISSNPRTPNLAGQQADYLVAQLQAFRSGTRTHQLMQAVAAQLDDAQIEALARYWSSRPASGGDPHAASAGSAILSRMAFPEDFPNGFTLYETATTNGAVTESYANDVAFESAKAGRPLPDGSIILVVNRASVGGPPTGYAAMESRAGWGASIPELIRNANWDYAAFDAQKMRNARLNQATCLACHRPQSANDFVFTLEKLRRAATGS